MRDTVKTKVGSVLAGAYLMLIVYGLIEFLTTPPESMKEFGMVVLTAPWSFAILVLLDLLGIGTDENSNSLLYFVVAVGGAINVALLYFLGLIISKLVSRVSSKG